MICTFLHSWAPALLLIGLGTRFSAVALFIMTLVIQIFVYPDAYPTHGVWAAVLLYLIVNWPGKIDVLFSQLTIPHAWYQKNAFSLDIILGRILWYAAYSLIYRHLEEMKQEFGVFVDYSSINRGAIRFLPLLENLFGHQYKWPVGRSWGRWMPSRN